MVAHKPRETVLPEPSQSMSVRSGPFGRCSISSLTERGGVKAGSLSLREIISQLDCAPMGTNEGVLWSAHSQVMQANGLLISFQVAAAC